MLPADRLPLSGVEHRLYDLIWKRTVATQMANARLRFVTATIAVEDATFRATGQTGILIAGEGVAVDAVVSDFVSGAAEWLSPANDDDHWDVIEGQGSLFHPAYAGVTLGLVHGSQPDALVVCHQAKRHYMHGYPTFKTPSIRESMERHLEAAKLTNPQVVCVGVSIDTSSMDEDSATEYLDEMEDMLGVPCVDPVKMGSADIVDRMEDL